MSFGFYCFLLPVHKYFLSPSPFGLFLTSLGRSRFYDFKRDHVKLKSKGIFYVDRVSKNIILKPRECDIIIYCLLITIKVQVPLYIIYNMLYNQIR